MDAATGELRFVVHVDDNFHAMDATGRYRHGAFASASDAIAAAQRIVDEFLIAAHRPGMKASTLFEQYTHFGEDPFIQCLGNDQVAFSAWNYAQSRCEAICRS